MKILKFLFLNLVIASERFAGQCATQIKVENEERIEKCRKDLMKGFKFKIFLIKT